MKEFQEFVKENQETIAKHAPKGWKYLGTYCYVLGFGPYHAALMWEITDYADLDTLRNHEDAVFWDLLEKKFAFLTQEPTPGWLLRKVGDTKITESKKEEE
jgi:hypothetical protein